MVAVTITEYDPFAAEVKANPYPYYDWLRREHPVYHNERLNIWALSCYDDVLAALRDTETFSSAQGIGPDRASVPQMIMRDPPEHRRLRSLAGKAFTPRRSSEREERVREIVCHLLDAALDQGSFDLARDVAVPLPVIVIAEMLGVEPERRHDFKRWSDDAVGSLAGDPNFDINLYLQAWQEFKAYFTAKIDERRAEPRDDLISALVTVQEEGQSALNNNEILNFNLLLLVAGNETTTNLICNGAAALLAHPYEAQKVREHPELIPSAVEECLRYDSPIQAFYRTTTRDVEVRGVTIPKDSKVMMMYGSANRDPEQFESPEDFRVDREPNDHLAFGMGIHYCLGAPLARLEARLVYEEFIKRFNNVRVDPEGTVERIDNPLFRGLKSFPLLFDRM
jgi:cytochrome P450